MSRACKGEHSLPPEFTRALGVMRSQMKGGLQPLASISADVWQHGTNHLYSGHFTSRDIPSEAHWRWNQTRAPETLTIDGRTIRVLKLSARPRLPGDHRAPSLKLWQFSISQGGCQYAMTLFWCEKGRTDDSFSHSSLHKAPSEPEESPDWNSLRLEDFSFLYHFMADPKLASFLWPTY